MGTYTKSSINRTARPRSERLRKLGGLIVPVGAAASSGGSIVPTGTDHTHANLADLNRIVLTGVPGAEPDGYIYLTDEVIDPLTQEASIVSTKAMAGYADRAGANVDGYDLDWFIPVMVDGTPTLKLNPAYAGIWAEGWIADGGVGSGYTNMRYVACADQNEYDGITTKDNGTVYVVGNGAKIYIGSARVFSQS